MKHFLFSLVCCVIVLSGYAQDPHFTQFENSPFFVNPASAGMIDQGDVRGSMIARNQWRKLVRPTMNALISVDAPLLRFRGSERSKSNMGIGLLYGYSALGDSKTRQTQLALALSGMTRLGKGKYLGIGVSAGKGGIRSDLSNASWDSQFNGYMYDPTLPSNDLYEGKLKARYLDLSAGVNFLSVNKRSGGVTNIGFSYLHANSPALKNEPLLNGNIDARIVAHLRSEINLGIKNAFPVFLIPRFLFGYQGVHMEMQAGASVFVVTKGTSQITSNRHKEGFEAGVMYRYNDAIGFIAAYKLENLRIGLCYDIAISAYGEAAARRGGTEISLIYYGINKQLRDSKPVYE